MVEKNSTDQDIVHNARRAFLKKAGTAAVAAPAAALLLSASAVPNQAIAASGGSIEEQFPG